MNDTVFRLVGLEKKFVFRKKKWFFVTFLRIFNPWYPCISEKKQSKFRLPNHFHEKKSQKYIWDIGLDNASIIYKMREVWCIFCTILYMWGTKIFAQFCICVGTFFAQFCIGWVQNFCTFFLHFFFVSAAMYF